MTAPSDSSQASDSSKFLTKGNFFQPQFETPSGFVIHLIQQHKKSQTEKNIWNQQCLPRIQAVSLIFISIFEIAAAIIILPFAPCVRRRANISYCKFAVNGLTLFLTSVFRIIFNKYPDVDYGLNPDFFFKFLEEKSVDEVIAVINLKAILLKNNPSLKASLIKIVEEWFTNKSEYAYGADLATQVLNPSLLNAKGSEEEQSRQRKEALARWDMLDSQAPARNAELLDKKTKVLFAFGLVV